MGDDPDPSNDESSDDETQPPTADPPSDDPDSAPSDSDETVDSDEAGKSDSDVASDGVGVAAEDDVAEEATEDDVAEEATEDDVAEADDSGGAAAFAEDVADGDEEDDEFPDAETVKENVYGGGDDGESLWDMEPDNTAAVANGPDADADGEAADADTEDDEPYEEQLEQARENNPPLDRDEVEENSSMVPESDPYGMDDDGDEGASTVDDEFDDAGFDDEEDDLFDGPETDEEMPLAVHIEEMMKRLGVVFIFAGVATAIAFPYASEMINYLWSYHIPSPMENRPRLYGPLELVLTRLKVATISGVIVGLPVFVYESYLFMRPGLYRTERRYYLAAVPTSLVLGAIGMVFAHFLVLPAIFAYFTSYTTGVAIVAYGLAETFNLIVMLISFMAVVFQIPLFIMLAIMMGLVTREWLEDKRLVFWGTFFGIAFIFSPDPTGMAPIIVTLTMIGLYEGTLALLRWTGN
ncbi:MAG: twin-arginine translocase subunit TatC [Halopenitus sp.]